MRAGLGFLGFRASSRIIKDPVRPQFKVYRVRREGELGVFGVGWGGL